LVPAAALLPGGGAREAIAILTNAALTTSNRDSQYLFVRDRTRGPLDAQCPNGPLLP
jgi:hypothetical protein